MNDQEKLKLLQEKSEVLKAIAHPVRLCILSCLMESGNCNVTTLADKLHKPQSTVSQHLSKLRNAGVVEGERNGVEMKYQIIDEDIERVVKIMIISHEEDGEL